MVEQICRKCGCSLFTHGTDFTLNVSAGGEPIITWVTYSNICIRCAKSEIKRKVAKLYKSGLRTEFEHLVRKDLSEGGG